MFKDKNLELKMKDRLGVFTISPSFVDNRRKSAMKS